MMNSLMDGLKLVVMCRPVMDLVVFEEYEAGTRNGFVKSYLRETKRLYLVEEFKDGVRDGVVRTYHDDGITVWLSEMYKGGKKDGLTVNYDRDGNKFIERLYEKGVLVNLVEYNFGFKKVEEIYKDGVIVSKKYL